MIDDFIKFKSYIFLVKYRISSWLSHPNLGKQGMWCFASDTSSVKRDILQGSPVSNLKSLFSSTVNHPGLCIALL